MVAGAPQTVDLADMAPLLLFLMGMYVRVCTSYFVIPTWCTLGIESGIEMRILTWSVGRGRFRRNDVALAYGERDRKKQAISARPMHRDLGARKGCPSPSLIRDGRNATYSCTTDDEMPRARCSLGPSPAFAAGSWLCWWHGVWPWRLAREKTGPGNVSFQPSCYSYS